VELRAAEVVATHDRGEVPAVFGGGDGERPGGRSEAVHEIHVVERAHPVEQRIGLREGELVPAHVRHGQTRREGQLVDAAT